MDAKAEHRKKFLVPRDFMMRIVLIPVLGAFIVLNVVLILFILSFNSARTSLNFGYWPLLLGVTEIILLILIYRFSIITSHRIAGPLHRLHLNLKRVAAGDLTAQSSYRKFDFNTEIIDQYNESLERLAEQIREYRKQAELVAQSCSDPKAVDRLQQLGREFKLDSANEHNED